MSSKKTKIAVALLSSLFLFSGVGFAATESSGESESHAGEFTILGSGGESSSVSNIGTSGVSVSLSDSGSISGGLYGMKNIIAQAVDRGICSPPSSISEACYCFSLLDVMNYRYGSSGLDDSVPDKYGSSFTPEQRLFIFASAAGDAEAQAVLFSQDPDLLEYASPYEQEALMRLTNTSLTESDIVSNIWDNRMQLKQTYFSTFSEIPLEEWERLGFLKDYDTPYDFVGSIPTSERIEYTESRYNEKQQLQEQQAEWREDVSTATNLSDSEKDSLLSSADVLDSVTKSPITVALVTAAGGAVIWAGGSALKKLIEPQFIWYANRMEEIKENPRD